MRICKNCQGPIPDALRQDARHCKENCRNVVYQRKHRRDTLSQPLPPAMLELLTYLFTHAPAEAIGCRLLIVEPERPPIVYPPQGRRSRRFDGRFSDRSYFPLNPPEAPRVPKAMLYQIEFVDAAGALVPTPYGLTGGVYVPIASRMCMPGKTHVERAPAK